MITKIKSFCRSARVSFLALCGMWALSSAVPQQASAYDINYDCRVYGSGRNYQNYRAVIRDLRNRVATQTITQGIQYETGQVNYFTVRIQHEHGTLGVVFRTDNLYIVGYYNPTNNTYNYIGNDSPRTRMGYPGNFTHAQIQGIRVQEALATENYDRLAAAPYHVNRINMRLGASEIHTAVGNLLNGRETIQERAGAVVLLAQVLAESARFRSFSDQIALGLLVYGHRVTILEAALQKAWDDLSNFLVYLLRVGRTRGYLAVGYQGDEFVNGNPDQGIIEHFREYHTVEDVRRDLAVCHYQIPF